MSDCFPGTMAGRRLIGERDICLKNSIEAVITEDCDMIVSFLLDDIHYKVKISITKRYPFDAPSFVLLEPFIYYFPKLPIIETWGPTHQSALFIKAKCIELHKKRDEMSKTIPSVTSPAYLVLGSSPFEEKQGRTHYNNKEIFLLNDTKISSYYKPPKPETINDSRFFLKSFASPEQLGILSSLLQKKFDEICFDWSTLKFFTFDYDDSMMDHLKKVNPELRKKLLENGGERSMLLERLIYLKNMLKDTGKIYFENISGPPGGGSIVGRNTTDYKALFLDYCSRAGFLFEEKTVKEIGSSSVLVPHLFDERVLSENFKHLVSPDTPLLVAQKSPSAEAVAEVAVEAGAGLGGKRKTMRKLRKTRRNNTCRRLKKN
jgi:hypothetical protein